VTADIVEALSLVLHCANDWTLFAAPAFDAGVFVDAWCGTGAVAGAQCDPAQEKVLFKFLPLLGWSGLLFRFWRRRSMNAWCAWMSCSGKTAVYPLVDADDLK